MRTFPHFLRRNVFTLSDLIVANGLSHLRFHRQRLGTSLDLKPEVEIPINLFIIQACCYTDYKNNVDRSSVLYSYVLLSRVKSAGVTEITTFEGTLHSHCIRILLSLI